MAQALAPLDPPQTMTNTEIIEIQGFGRFEIPAGLSDEEIATISEDIVQSERSQAVTPVEAAGAAGKGVNVGLANFAGSIYLISFLLLQTLLMFLNLGKAH